MCLSLLFFFLLRTTHPSIICWIIRSAKKKNFSSTHISHTKPNGGVLQRDADDPIFLCISGERMCKGDGTINCGSILCWSNDSPKYPQTSGSLSYLCVYILCFCFSHSGVNNSAMTYIIYAWYNLKMLVSTWSKYWSLDIDWKPRCQIIAVLCSGY